MEVPVSLPQRLLLDIRNGNNFDLSVLFAPVLEALNTTNFYHLLYLETTLLTVKRRTSFSWSH